jgi:hypothetical protein
MMLMGMKSRNGIVGQVRIQAWIDHQIGVDGHEQGVAVRGRARDLPRGKSAVGAGLVLDDHRLPHGVAQAIREAARDQVDGAACRLRQHEANGLRRIRLVGAGAGCCQVDGAQKSCDRNRRHDPAHARPPKIVCQRN